jgi:hypothetical protein
VEKETKKTTRSPLFLVDFEPDDRGAINYTGDNTPILEYWSRYPYGNGKYVEGWVLTLPNDGTPESHFTVGSAGVDVARVIAWAHHVIAVAC